MPSHQENRNKIEQTSYKVDEADRSGFFFNLVCKTSTPPAISFLYVISHQTISYASISTDICSELHRNDPWPHRQDSTKPGLVILLPHMNIKDFDSPHYITQTMDELLG